MIAGFQGVTRDGRIAFGWGGGRMGFGGRKLDRLEAMGWELVRWRRRV